MPWLHANTIKMAYHIMQYLPIHVHITSLLPLSSITFNSDWTIEIVSFKNNIRLPDWIPQQTVE